jgi:GNAT superfamily N-acetyltransferase
MGLSLTEKSLETIRMAGPRDAEALRAISRDTFAAAFGDLYSPADLAAFLAHAHTETERELADPAVAAWLMEAEGSVIGYALAGPCGLDNPQVTPRCGELKRLYLMPAWQSGGRGSRLLEMALAWLERDGPRPIWIGVFSENTGAQRLYARYGFEKVGEHTFAVGSQIDREFTLRRG